MIKCGKKLFYCWLVFLFGCVNTKFEDEKKNSKKEFEKIIYSLVNKTPNEMYSIIGKPQNNEIKFDKNGNIMYAVLSYQYVYNFNTKQYECEIDFITNKQQSKIVDVRYSSNKCLYLTMY